MLLVGNAHHIIQKLSTEDTYPFHWQKFPQRKTTDAVQNLFSCSKLGVLLLNNTTYLIVKLNDSSYLTVNVGKPAKDCQPIITCMHITKSTPISDNVSYPLREGFQPT